MRLLAVERELKASLIALGGTEPARYGGFVEKTAANIDSALADVTAGLQYLEAHPALETPTAWEADDSMHGAEPRPLWSLADPDAKITAAYQDLRKADSDFITGAGMHPYQVGDIGGYRDKIRTDIEAAASNLVTCIEFSNAPVQPPGTGGELVIDGGFESPSSLFSAAQSPSRLDWRAIASSAFNPMVAQIYRQGTTVTNRVPARTYSYQGAAAEGQQWLWLRGSTGYPAERETQGNAIEEILATVPDRQYALTFAYANNPNPWANPVTRVVEELRPGTVVVTIRDSSTETDLIAPVMFAGSGATFSDYHWSQSGPIAFYAKSTHTTLRFQIRDYSARTDGIFLDAISVKASK